ncbi:MAG TPA: NAD(P)-dependent alcohol dehydrogenase [Luteibaculaceae bacterium]|nr:NAD(P)-dependent alcohol dehydrogenase [Luteibaculaceae bacterium]
MERTMKAAVCTAYGKPNTVKLARVPVPIPKPGQMLIRIRATALNSGDVRVRGLKVSGWMKAAMLLVLGWNKPRKPILGTVFAGKVEEINGDSKRFRPGDRVFGLTGFGFGCHAQYLCVSADGLVEHMPEGASFTEAAALLFGGQTAHYFLSRAAIKPQSQLLVLGAGGSVGIAAVQYGLIAGAEVTALCGARAREMVYRLGAHHIIDYRQVALPNITARFDVIFDAVGLYPKKAVRHLLKSGGKYRTVGGMNFAAEEAQQLLWLKQQYERGLLRAVVDSVYPLDEIAAAHSHVDSFHKVGNVVVTVD